MTQAVSEKQIVLNKTKKIVKVERDDWAESPRQWDNQAKMFCSHRRYDLGDDFVNKKFNTNDYDSWEELQEAIEETYDVAYITPLSLYDHSMISLHVGSMSGWDCGRVGFAFFTEDTVKEIFGDLYTGKLTEPMIKKLDSILEAEISTYNDYLWGDVYCIAEYDVYEDETGMVKHEELVDSCCGFYFNKDYTAEMAIKDTFGLSKGEYDLIEE